jgi:hypothetical protein
VDALRRQRPLGNEHWPSSSRTIGHPLSLVRSSHSRVEVAQILTRFVHPVAVAGYSIHNEAECLVRAGSHGTPSKGDAGCRGGGAQFGSERR